MITDNEEYVEFNASRQFGQNQYAVRLLEGEGGAPCLGNGLRFSIDESDYHDTKIHKDDEVRFEIRYTLYQTLRDQNLFSIADKLLETIKEHGELKVSDPSHYDYLKWFYGQVCLALGVPDRYNGNFSADGDKMYQYRDRWVEAGVPWFHGTVCYMLMNSIYPHEVRQTLNGWVDPCQWVIDNYHHGKKLVEYMIDGYPVIIARMLKWG